MEKTKTSAKPNTAKRRRTPGTAIRPKVEIVLKQMIDEGKMLPRREIARRAGISQQTLYNHALDLVETAELTWAPAPQPESKKKDYEEVLRQKDVEIRCLEKRLNDLTERLTWMLDAVQQFAPKALPQVTLVLSPAYVPEE